jgi:hypothetical protein
MMINLMPVLMKKLLYLVSLLLMFQLPAFTQTTVINEDFEDDLTGWEFEGNWFHEPGYIFLYYHPITLDYDFWVTSPEFEVPVTGGDLIMNHFIDVYAVNVTNEKCEISVIYDGQEEVVWEHDLSDGSWGDIFGTDMLIPLDEFLGETVQLKFRSYGAKSNALWGWFIFNLNLTTFFNHDLAALEILGPGNVDPGQTGNWMLNVKNLGLQPATDFDIKLYSYKEDNHVAEGSFSGAINTGETGQVPVSWTTDEVHNTVLYAVIEDDNDQFLSNNKSRSHFLRIEPEQYYNVLLWDNDNGITTVVNPETGVLQHPNTGIEKALQNAGIEYTYTTNLPQSIGQYDIIISTLGCYCLS